MVFYLKFVTFKSHRNLQSIDTGKITMTLIIYKKHDKRLYIDEENGKAIRCVCYQRTQIFNTDIRDLVLRQTNWSPKVDSKSPKQSLISFDHLKLPNFKRSNLVALCFIILEHITKLFNSFTPNIALSCISFI